LFIFFNFFVSCYLVAVGGDFCFFFFFLGDGGDHAFFIFTSIFIFCRTFVFLLSFFFGDLKRPAAERARSNPTNQLKDRWSAHGCIDDKSDSDADRSRVPLANQDESETTTL